jgi:D-alanine-D-alanine ligase
MKKLNLMILFGGASNEHEVSRMSCASILKEIDKEKYNIIKVGITKSGKWFLTEATPEDIHSGTWEISSSNRPVTVNLFGEKGLFTQDGEEISVDCAYPVMHGKNAEDGTMQGLFEIAGIPYVGPGVLASSTGMDKIKSKLVAQVTGVKQAKYYATNRYQFSSGPLVEMEKIIKHFDNQYPLFVKPANSGSSVGITKAHNERELFEGIKLAAEVDHGILIEEGIVGREIEVAVLGNRDPHASLIGEILSANEMYDYEAKYLNAESKTKIVDDLDKDTEESIRKMAVDIYKAFSCKGLSRVDFFYTEDGELIFNEINTLPGFTSISMYPQLWEATGIKYSELIDKLIDLAMEEE